MLHKAAVIGAVFWLIATVGETLAQTTGPNGGLVGGKGSHQAELIVSATELTVYLLDNGKVHTTEGMSLRAVVQEGGKTATISLADQGGMRMVGKLAAPLGKGAIVVLTGKDHHGDVVNARYVLN